MTDELKPCPFCGGEAKIKCGEIVNRYNTAVYRHYHVECMSCGVDTRNFDTDDEAIEAWNRRTDRTAKVQELPRRSETSLDWEGKCSNCGAYTIHDMNYCFECGAKLDWSDDE